MSLVVHGLSGLDSLTYIPDDSVLSNQLKRGSRRPGERLLLINRRANMNAVKPERAYLLIFRISPRRTNTYIPSNNIGEMGISQIDGRCPSDRDTFGESSASFSCMALCRINEQGFRAR